MGAHNSSKKGKAIVPSTPRKRSIPAAGYDYRFKIRVLGDVGVGKSSLVFRAAENYFSDTFSHILDLEYHTIHVDCCEFIVQLELYDTSAYLLRSCSMSMYRGFECVMVVFDLGCEKSWLNAQKWYYEVSR
jgi:GTPase SAR1 family protein